MGAALVIGGIVMWIVDAMNAKSEAAGQGAPQGRIHTWHMEEMSLGQAVWIGACEILSAVFPGTSRSMSTITAGQLAGMSRASALEFSFFLSMPVMAAATLYDLLKSLVGKGDNALGVGAASTSRAGSSWRSASSSPSSSPMASSPGSCPGSAATDSCPSPSTASSPAALSSFGYRGSRASASPCDSVSSFRVDRLNRSAFFLGRRVQSVVARVRNAAGGKDVTLVPSMPLPDVHRFTVFARARGTQPRRTREAGESIFSDFLPTRGSAAVRPRCCAPSLLRLHACRKYVPGGRGDGSSVCDGTLGHRHDVLSPALGPTPFARHDFDCATGNPAGATNRALAPNASANSSTRSA